MAMSLVPWMMARPSAKTVTVWGPRRKRSRRSLERRESMSACWRRRAVRVAKSMGRWCSWIWTESRPQRVMGARSWPARWVKIRRPQTSQSGRWSSGGDLGAVEGVGGGWVPEIEGEQSAAHKVRLAGEEFQGFVDLDGGGEVDGGGEDAGGVAGVDVAGGRFGEDAGEAGGGGVGGRREMRGLFATLFFCNCACGRMFMVAA